MSDTYYPQPPASPPPPSYRTIEDDNDYERVPSPTSTISGTTWLLEQPAESHASTSTLSSTLSSSSTDTFGAGTSVARSASCTSTTTSASSASSTTLVRAPSPAQPPWQGAGGGVVVARQCAPPKAGQESTTYTFAQLTHRALLLLPADVPGAAPLYHVAVETNCFCPASHVTVLRRGSEQGAFVGEFEIGYGPAAPRLNRVALGAHASLLAAPAVYWEHHPVCPLPRLRWNFAGAALRWDPARAKGRAYFKCTAPDPRRKKVVHDVASFYPPDPLRAVDGVRPAAMLRVERGWEHVMDHVLMSVLMLQQDSKVKN